MKLFKKNLIGSSEISVMILVLIGGIAIGLTGIITENHKQNAVNPEPENITLSTTQINQKSPQIPLYHILYRITYRDIHGDIQYVDTFKKPVEWNDFVILETPEKYLFLRDIPIIIETKNPAQNAQNNQNK